VNVVSPDMTPALQRTAAEAADALISWEGDLEALAPLADRYVAVASEVSAIDVETWCKLTAAAATTMAALVLESIGAEERGDEAARARANELGQLLQKAAVGLCDAYPLRELGRRSES
jgi:hypothetical protein